MVKKQLTKGNELVKTMTIYDNLLVNIPMVLKTRMDVDRDDLTQVEAEQLRTIEGAVVGIFKLLVTARKDEIQEQFDLLDGNAETEQKQ